MAGQYELRTILREVAISKPIKWPIQAETLQDDDE